MKKILRFGSLAVLALISLACGKDVIYELPDGDKYDCLYLVQAANSPQALRFTSRTEAYSAPYSAFYSSLSAPKDIRMTFEVDNTLVEEYNAANNTSYLPLPEGSYELDTPSATIKAGEYRTKLMNLNINIKGYLEPLVDYMLPLKMKTSGVKVSEGLDVIYYTVNVAKDLSPIKIGGKIKDCYEFFSFNDKCILTRDRNGNGELIRYAWNEAENKFEEGQVMKTGWQYGTVPYISAGQHNTLQVVNGYWTWIVLRCNEDATEIPNLDGYISIVTGGCGIFLDPIANPHTSGFLAVNGSSGWLHHYEMNNDWSNITGGNISCTGDFNFWSYRLRFCYEGDVYGIDTAGNLWRHPWNSATVSFGNREQMGAGWGRFTHITPWGKNLLVRNADGSLQMYEFDTRMFWDVSEEN